MNIIKMRDLKHWPAMTKFVHTDNLIDKNEISPFEKNLIITSELLKYVCGVHGSPLSIATWPCELLFS